MDVVDVKAKCNQCESYVTLKVKAENYSLLLVPYWSCPNENDGKHTMPIRAIDPN